MTDLVNKIIDNITYEQAGLLSEPERYIRCYFDSFTNIAEAYFSTEQTPYEHKNKLSKVSVKRYIKKSSSYEEMKNSRFNYKLSFCPHDDVVLHEVKLDEEIKERIHNFIAAKAAEQKEQLRQEGEEKAQIMLGINNGINAEA